MRSLSSILWAVQTKLLQEDSTAHLVQAFQKFGLHWAAFPLPPFVGELPRFPWDGPIIYYGSTKLIDVLGSRPDLRAGAAFFYDSEKFAASWYGPRLGEMYLNASAKHMTLGEALAIMPDGEERFVRPDAGMKLFGGAVMDVAELRRISEQRGGLGTLELGEATPVLVNEPVKIDHEYRTWYVGGKISAVVHYRRHARLEPRTLTEDDPNFAGVWAFAFQQGKKLDELGAFVLDVADVGGLLFVVEINCIHTAGFYTAEPIEDVVMDITTLVRERP